MLASSSTRARVASTNLLKAGEVQLGIRAWWRAAMWCSLEDVVSVVLKDEAYCQEERQTCLHKNNFSDYNKKTHMISAPQNNHSFQ